MDKNIIKSYPYVRVATNYYKYIWYPLLSGDTVERLIMWNADNIIKDESKQFLKDIDKFDGFCHIPDHINFKQIINNHINRYEPIVWKPFSGDCPLILSFLEHIFEEQLEIGLDYIAILFLSPKEKLPILCLVSKERNTGKTTFLNLLQLIFGANFTLNTNEDFRSNFNSHWANKLIAACDETLQDRKEDSEKVKNLSTALTLKSESKGVDKSEIETIVKFIFCSNNVDNFIYVEPGETRFWVRKINTLSHENENLLMEMKEQIPAFLDFIIKRGIKTPKTTRMWFDFKLIETSALKRLIKTNRNKLEMQIINTICEIMDCSDLNEYCFCIKDLLSNLAKTNRSGGDHGAIIRIVRDEWKLNPKQFTSTYITHLYGNEGFLKTVSDKGRYYTIKREWLQQNFGDLVM